jgi:AhpC/TSA family
VNCQRTLPWVREAIGRFGDRGFRVIGIHSPEFEYELDHAALEKAVRQHGLDYPHFLDDRHAYWQALGNQYWPTLYLVDKCGRVRARQIGEVLAGSSSAARLDEKIGALLAETGDCQAP